MGTMTCPACRSTNDPESRFCGTCGAVLQRQCPGCGELLSGELAFCTTCGAPTVGSRAERPRGEERRLVTVLFADLVGFTARAEALDPEDVRALLAPYHARVRAEIERFGGTVEKFIGDAVMALFGAPVAREDDGERAVRAALAVRDAVARAGDDTAEAALQVRIGVATGEALVVLDARPQDGEGMAAGDIVNTAARLQSGAPVNGILVGEGTYRATRHAIAYREHHPVAAKGKTKPVRAWEALAPTAETIVALPEDAPVAFVGRRAELAGLLAALGEARGARRPMLVTLVGAAGLGKSRLLYELFVRVDEQVEWLRGRSPAYGDGVAFWALGEMAKAGAGILETDTAEEAEAKLHGTLGSLLGPTEAGWVERHLRPLVGLGEDAEVRGDNRGEVFAAWRRYFEAAAGRKPLLLAFEDLHWADEGLLDFIELLVASARDVPLLVVATTRPELLERRPAFGADGGRARRLDLAPLTGEETAELLTALFQQAEIPAGVADALVSRSEGNPLYAGEYARMLFDRGYLRRADGAWRLARRDELPLPESVQSVISARLDALSVEEKSLVQDAAVIGKVFWLGGLVAVSGRERARAEALLVRLEHKELVRRERRTVLAGETQYSFGHVLVRDVAYGQIARARRAETHRLAAEWLEGLAAGRAENLAEMLAHHYVSALRYAQAARQHTAGLSDRARLVLRDAGDRASGLGAFGPAARFYAAALELWPDEDPGRPELLFRSGQALYHAEQGGEPELAAARDGLVERGNRALAAEAEVMIYGLLSGRGQRGEALAHLRRAGDLVAAEGASRSKAYVLTHSSRYFMLAAEEEQAIRVGRQALAMAEELGLDELRAHALTNIGLARVTSGDHDGVADMERAIAIATAINSPESVRASKVLGATLLLLGELSRTARLFASGREAADRFGDAYNIRWLAGAEVLELYWAGQWDEAVAEAERFFAVSDATGPHYMEAVCRRVRALARLGRGELAAAGEDAEKALAFARTARDPWLLHPALATAARIGAAAGATEQAGRHADELLGIWAHEDAILSYELPDLVVALESLERADDLRGAALGVEKPTRWLLAAAAFAAGDFEEAARLYAEIGSLPDEAFARLRAAETLLAQGRRREAGAELERALGFFRRAGATGLIQDAEVLHAGVV